MWYTLVWSMLLWNDQCHRISHTKWGKHLKWSPRNVSLTYGINVLKRDSIFPAQCDLEY